MTAKVRIEWITYSQGFDRGIQANDPAAVYQVQTISAISSTAVQSNAAPSFPAKIGFARVWCLAGAVIVAWGSNPTVTEANGLRIEAGQYRDIACSTGDLVSLLEAQDRPFGSNKLQVLTDGQGNIPRPSPRLYSGGTPIEFASATLSSNGAATGPIGMVGYSNLALNLSGTWSGTVQFETNPSLDNSTWVATAIPPLGGGTAVSNTTANGTWVYTPTGDLPFRLHTTAWTSGTATVMPSKGGASAATGLPLYAHPEAYNAIKLQNEYANTVIDPSAFGSPAYSTVAADEAPYGSTGLGDIGVDVGIGTSGQHAIYSSNAVYGSVHSGTISSNTNPYSYNANTGALSLTSGYSTPDSWWQGWQFTLSSSDFYQVEGYTAPAYNFYVEVSAQMPVGGATAGFYPWFAPVWITDGSNYYNGGGPFNLNANLQGYTEFDGPEFGTLSTPGGSIDGSHYLVTLHDWPPSAGGQPGQIQAQRSTASPLSYLNLYDGNYHTYGILVTKNYFVAFIDRKELYRIMKPSLKESLGRWTIKSNNSFFNVPTAANTTTVVTTINAIRVWEFEPGTNPLYPA